MRPFRTTRTDIKILVRQLNERGALCSPPFKRFEATYFKGQGYQLSLCSSTGFTKFPFGDVTTRSPKEFVALLEGMLAMMPPAGK
jgi:hypothetical protein